MKKFLNIKLRRKFPLFIAAIFLTGFFFNLSGIKPSPIICWNFSGSQPIGIYKIVSDTSISTGDLVVMKVPENVREYVYGRDWVEEGKPLLKTVAAVGGEKYSITDKEIRVKDTYIGPVFEKDRNGLPLPILKGDFTVKEGCFLLLSQRTPNSFDGRYFGDVPIDLIVCKVEPLFVIP